MRISILTVFAISSCVSLLPVELRQSEEVVETGVKKDVAYNRALVWFAKSLNNSNQAVQVKDPDAGRIVSNMRASCPDLGSALNALYYGGQYVDVSVDFQAKDSKARIRFENIRHFGTNAYGQQFDLGPTSQEAVEEIKTKCLSTISSQLLKAVTARTDDF